MNETQLNETRERRLAACIKMVEDAYQVDGYGVAELIGMSKRAWTTAQKSPWLEKRLELFVGLYNLTGVRVSWLFCDDLEKELLIEEMDSEQDTPEPTKQKQENK